MSTFDPKPFESSDGRSSGRNEPPPEMPSASTLTTDLSSPYQGFNSMNGLSMLDFNYLNSSSTQLNHSEDHLGVTPFPSTEAADQLSGFGAHPGVYSSAISFDETVNVSANQGGFPLNSATVGFSPESYISGHSGAEVSHYNTPMFDESLLEAQFGSSLSLNPGGVSIEGGISDAFTGNDMGNTRNGFPQTYSNHTSPYPSSMAVQSSLSPAQLSSPMGGSPSASDQPPAQRPQLLSPTVRIEYVGPGESPRRSRVRRASSKKSQDGKRSNTLLSPYPEDFSSSEDGVDPLDRQSSIGGHTRAIAPNRRNDDGTWATQGSAGVSGIGPDARKEMLDVTVPTIEELEQHRHLEERKAGVEDWLARSEVGSEAGSFDGEAKSPHRKRAGRPRARSANDVSATGASLDVVSINGTHVIGPGLLINDSSELDYDEEGNESKEPESPAADAAMLGQDGLLNHDDNASSGCSRPWVDPEPCPVLDSPGTRTQPITSNAAIMRFKERAKEVDNASLAATVGSGRRRSESDLGSVVAAAGISKALISTVDDGRPTDRKATLFGTIRGSILPNRGGSGKLKRKGSQNSAHLTQNPDASAAPPKEAQPNLSPPKRMGSFGRPKSPKLDTNVPTVVQESRSPISGIDKVKGMIRRNRSRSDLGKSPENALGLAALWKQAGGPPVAKLASPLTANGRGPSNPQDGDDDSGDEDGVGPDGMNMDLSVRTDVSIPPTYDGFKYHARNLNPRVEYFLLERLSQEQLRRYNRLVESKIKHAQSVSNRSCPSKAFCFALGGAAKQLPPRPGNRDPDATLVGFQIMAPGQTEEDIELSAESQVIPAQFPAGVPIPPVKRLPAEFECPLCFKVKKFHKPSDWTKHVHEDVQPFTCTFQQCSEPKSFKRKADWVRHENERHRQLESWTCNIADCSHTCYRKDNFVQHLVREHKVPEPKVRTGRTPNSRSPITPLDSSQLAWPGLPLSAGDDISEDVWAIVEKCRRGVSKSPADEPCRFCGNVCSSWKKLTVHLAKHMEQISMPVLTLIEQQRAGTPAAPNFAPNVSVPSMQTAAMGSVMPLAELAPGILCAEPSEFDADSPTMAGNGEAAQVMQTYPPPNMSGLMAQVQPPTSAPYVGQTYPPVLMGSRSRSTSFNETQTLQVPNGPGSSFPPVGVQAATQLTPHMDQHHSFLSPQTVYSSPGMLGVQTRFLSPGMGTPESYGYVQQDESLGNGTLHGPSMGLQHNYTYGG